MHDPTEGGIRAGLHELAFASRVCVQHLELRFLLEDLPVVF
jgi:hydrogenase maturation factor